MRLPRARGWLNCLRNIGALLFIVLVLCGIFPISEWLSLPLAKSRPLRHADAIVILSGGIRDRDTLTTESASRLLHGIRLYRLGYAPIVILTGGNPRQPSVPEARVMAEIARTLGVTAASLITETQANRTSAQGSAVARIARDYNVRSVLLVTGPTHMLRACLVFKKHGFDVIPAPTMVPKVETIVIVTPDRVLGRIGALGPVLYEYAALTLYWWRGWV